MFQIFENLMMNDSLLWRTKTHILISSQPFYPQYIDVVYIDPYEFIIICLFLQLLIVKKGFPAIHMNIILFSLHHFNAISSAFLLDLYITGTYKHSTYRICNMYYIHFYMWKCVMSMCVLYMYTYVYINSYTDIHSRAKVGLQL